MNAPALVAQIDTIRVVGLSEYDRTVAQDKFDQMLREFPRNCEGNIMRVLAASLDDAYESMASQLRQYFSQKMEELRLSPENVGFELRYSDVKNGYFWNNLSTCTPGSARTLTGKPCTQYR